MDVLVVGRGADANWVDAEGGKCAGKRGYIRKLGYSKAAISN